MGLSGKWIDKVHQRRRLRDLILDMDSSVSEPEQSTYVGRGKRAWPTLRGARALKATETAHRGRRIRPGDRRGGGAMLHYSPA